MKQKQLCNKKPASSTSAGCGYEERRLRLGRGHRFVDRQRDSAVNRRGREHHVKAFGVLVRSRAAEFQPAAIALAGAVGVVAHRVGDVRRFGFFLFSHDRYCVRGQDTKRKFTHI